MNAHIRLLPALALALMLCACGGGDEGTTNDQNGIADFNVSSPSVAPRVPQSQDLSGQEFCKDQANGRLGSYLLVNNNWNKGAVTNYTSCLTMRPGADGSVSPTWRWDWPLSSNESIHAFPELFFGQNPWFSSSTTAALPRVINTIKDVTARFGAQVTHSNNGGGNFAFDIWITKASILAPGASNLPLHTELMILLDEWGNFSPVGDKIGETTIDGRDWNVYQITATWGPGPWQFVTYQPKQKPSSPYQVSVRLFLDDLIARRVITGAEWLSSIDLGNEVIAGAGTTTLQDYSVEVR
ncbi:GH12 family glycosyl hydrolase domain-containing protein [Niveibacterium microcysteis]|uniref:Uncharacterized protein n=1 Tax=Niveibacterium microcysteis TaxID=2811415 RepID=A0ABX7M6S0_9RHOO|nr:hypothetical protein [Niveibacterium microcysteis]QSI77453.1 hypothetical protein JY500_02000 [Niveibacterium microcysteis]